MSKDIFEVYFTELKEKLQENFRVINTVEFQERLQERLRESLNLPKKKVDCKCHICTMFKDMRNKAKKGFERLQLGMYANVKREIKQNNYTPEEIDRRIEYIRRDIENYKDELKDLFILSEFFKLQ